MDRTNYHSNRGVETPAGDEKTPDEKTPDEKTPDEKTPPSLLEEVDGVWVTATESLFDSGWDCPTEEDWDGYKADSDDSDNMDEEESDKVTAKFWWLGPCTATAETHEAPGTPSEYRLTVGVQQHLAKLLVDAVRSEEKQLTPFMVVVRKYVDGFFKQGHKESVRVLPDEKGVELRFTSTLAKTSNPVWLSIQFTADAAERHQPVEHVFNDKSC